MIIAATRPYDEGGFKVLLAFHILAAAVWLGGAIALVTLSELSRARDERPLGVLAERVRRIVLAPAALVVFGCGMGLVAVGGYGFGTLWVTLALCGWAASFIVELPLATTDPLHEVRGDGDAARRRAQRAALELHLARLQGLLLVLIVLDMVLRP